MKLPYSVCALTWYKSSDRDIKNMTQACSTLLKHNGKRLVIVLSGNPLLTYQLVQSASPIPGIFLLLVSQMKCGIAARKSQSECSFFTNVLLSKCNRTTRYILPVIKFYSCTILTSFVAFHSIIIILIVVVIIIKIITIKIIIINLSMRNKFM